MSKKGIIIAVAAAALCGAVVFGSIAVRNSVSKKRFEEKLDAPLLPAAPKSSESGRDCIHFLSTGTSDAILLESDGRFAMVDSGEDFNISVEAIRRAITPRTKAIIPVDIAGYPCDYTAIMQLVNDPDVKSMFQPTSPVMEKLGRIIVINDSAHSIGSFYGNKRSGSQTDICIFSLHAVKNVTTAEGGAICLNMPAPFDNEQLYSELRMKSLNCQTKDAFTKSKAGGWRYDIVGMGMKANMADVNAAIGLAQIRKYPMMLQERKRIFDTYTEAFSKEPWAITPPTRQEGRETSYHVYALRIKDITEEQRDDIIAEISKSEVAVNVHFIPLPMLTLFHDMGYRIDDYPQAYENYHHEITLPCYPQLTDEQVQFVIKTVIEAYHTVIKK